MLSHRSIMYRRQILPRFRVGGAVRALCWHRRAPPSRSRSAPRPWSRLSPARASSCSRIVRRRSPTGRSAFAGCSTSTSRRTRSPAGCSAATGSSSIRNSSASTAGCSRIWWFTATSSGSASTPGTAAHHPDARRHRHAGHRLQRDRTTIRRPADPCRLAGGNARRGLQDYRRHRRERLAGSDLAVRFLRRPATGRRPRVVAADAAASEPTNSRRSSASPADPARAPAVPPHPHASSMQAASPSPSPVGRRRVGRGGERIRAGEGSALIAGMPHAIPHEEARRPVRG